MSSNPNVQLKPRIFYQINLWDLAFEVPEFIGVSCQQ